MIKFENTEVMNFEGALRGMRNPLNSWDKSDTYFGKFEDNVGCKYKQVNIGNGIMSEYLSMGENDLNLAQRLIKAGSDHRKFLRQIFVSVDITAPLYWWKEFDTYKVATVANSCSTMHTIHKRDFTRDDFSYEHLFSSNGKTGGPIDTLDNIIADLNYWRNRYVETKNKNYWYVMIQLLPTSYNQKRTVTLNYETIRNIYGSRRNHKLDEWSIGFMEWIDSLPYAEELIKSK